jgi:hypothetical protein
MLIKEKRKAPWVAQPVQVSAEALVQVDRAVVRAQAEEDEKIFYHTPVIHSST